MSKRKASAADPRQGEFGFFVSPTLSADTQASPRPAQSLDHAMREAVAETLNMATRGRMDLQSRDQVAEAMAQVLGRRVSKVQLDQWSAPSQEDRRIPADALLALGQVTGDWRALHVLVEACGFKALTPKEAVCAEFGALFAVRRRIDQRAKELTGDMEDLVGGLMARLKAEVAP